MTEPLPIDVHKALADDTRYRLYRHLRRSGRAVSIRELAARLSLHPNTLRPHLHRLEEAGLVTHEFRRGASVGRPQTLYVAVDLEGAQEHRLLAGVLAGLLTGARQRERAQELARDWGSYLVGRAAPKPGSRIHPGLNLAVLQGALADAGFDPRFRRGTRSVEISLRECPFRDLLEEHRELVCAVHRGLLEGMLGASRPPLRMTAFEPLADRSTICRLTARR